MVIHHCCCSIRSGRTSGRNPDYHLAIIDDGARKTASAPHLQNINARYLACAVGEIKRMQSASSDLKQKPLDVVNSARKGRIEFNLGYEVPPSREVVQSRWRGKQRIAPSATANRLRACTG
jgi:hypothetical protein